jgi:hypothetical protein
MPDKLDQEMQILLTGIIDVLGVIVGDRRLHLPTNGPPLSAHRRDGGPRRRALCGKTSGGVFARQAFAELPMCRNCLRIAANLIRADDWSEFRANWPPARPRTTRPRF